MSKQKKKNKKPAQTQQGGYKRFINDAFIAMKMIGYNKAFKYIDNDLKRTMYNRMYSIKNPKIKNGYISSQELETITKKVKINYRESFIKIGENYFSVYQLQLLSSYMWGSHESIKKYSYLYTEEEINSQKTAYDLVTQNFTNMLIVKFHNVGHSLSSPDFKYYNIGINPCISNKAPIKLVFDVEVYGIPSQKKILKINGYNRPVYRMCAVGSTNSAEWLSIETSILGDLYKGDKKEIDIYIQSHALKRLSERLDLLDKQAINYALCENTSARKLYEKYNGYIFLQFIVHDIKVGYLVANIIDDKLIFRTFLFVTHNSTPEGDKLKELTGLEKKDVSYWKIDRLSTLVNINEEKHPELVEILKDADLEDLMQLKDKDFNVDKMQETILDGFMEFLIKNKESMELINSENLISEEIN